MLFVGSVYFLLLISASFSFAKLHIWKYYLLMVFNIWPQDNAQKIAEFLASHPRVKKVNYAGIPGHPGRALHYSQVLNSMECRFIM